VNPDLQTEVSVVQVNPSQKPGLGVYCLTELLWGRVPRFDLFQGLLDIIFK
jgi:hypothetical protein